jgi:hypothetical protein
MMHDSDEHLVKSFESRKAAQLRGISQKVAAMSEEELERRLRELDERNPRTPRACPHCGAELLGDEAPR